MYGKCAVSVLLALVLTSCGSSPTVDDGFLAQEPATLCVPDASERIVQVGIALLNNQDHGEPAVIESVLLEGDKVRLEAAVILPIEDWITLVEGDSYNPEDPVWQRQTVVGGEDVAEVPARARYGLHVLLDADESGGTVERAVVRFSRGGKDYVAHGSYGVDLRGANETC